MTARAWPSREEWQAKAEYAVRTGQTLYERLDRLQPDTNWWSLGEETELEELASTAAPEMRRLLTAEINRLRELMPERPAPGRKRAAWFVALEGEAYDNACNLGALEEMRTDVQRARQKHAWGGIVWHLGRIRSHYPAVTLPEQLLTAHDRMTELTASADERRKQAAIAAEQAAVDKEIARRATDKAWAKELERRATIDHPRIIRVGQQTAPSKDDQMT
ncbi:hypothetical protein [Streptomyces gardneri]|uniref:hypothetical protein n=1 Tax=Streptomyces gardneri TaxID=66892 RepID=UPI0035E1EE81